MAHSVTGLNLFKDHVECDTWREIKLLICILEGSKLGVIHEDVHIHAYNGSS